jgi:hypothetical protein
MDEPAPTTVIIYTKNSSTLAVEPTTQTSPERQSALRITPASDGKQSMQTTKLSDPHFRGHVAA